MDVKLSRSTRDEAFHRMVAEGSGDLHTLTTVDGVYRFASVASHALFGWDPARLIGERQAAYAHPDDVPLVDAARMAAAADRSATITSVCRFRCADGTYRWTESLSRLVDADGEALVVSTVRDIGNRREFELDLQRQATTDPLTGVANRSVFMDHLRQALHRLDRRRGLVAVLFLDLDRFKRINDSLGHLMGDALLRETAERLQQVLRPQDTLARLGGDEFVILVEDITHVHEANALGRRIVAAARAPRELDDERLICTASVGIAVTHDSHHSPEGLLQEADLAMYRAKNRGRDRAEMFDDDLRTQAVSRLGTERMLRRAVEEERLRLAFQPIIDLRTSRLVGAEALARVWDPDQDDLLAAEGFIEVADEAGLLPTIDEWVLGRAIEQMTTWREPFMGADFPFIAMNVSARHLADPGFTRSVIDGLATHFLPTEMLQIEVTERVLTDASSSALTALKVLRRAGVAIGLDDFGTGYSSFSYLRRLPLDFVKIDSSLTRELDAGIAEGVVVGSIIELCHALGMAVVAEGVESATQLDQLTALDCDRAQGFFLGPPGPAIAVEDHVLRL